MVVNIYVSLFGAKLFGNMPDAKKPVHVPRTVRGDVPCGDEKQGGVVNVTTPKTPPPAPTAPADPAPKKS